MKILALYFVVLILALLHLKFKRDKIAILNEFDMVNSGSKEQIELLQLGDSGIRVAEYLTELPSKELLRNKLHKVIELERQRLIIKKE